MSHLHLWSDDLYYAVQDMLIAFPSEGLDPLHTAKTPQRVVESFQFLFAGVHKDASEPLKEALFPTSGMIDQMITVKDVIIYSMCAHHLLPFFGHATFAYIPDQHIVGLSKFPRFMDILAKRPQVQENLTQQIVDTFQDTVKPLGCAVMIRAYHLCMLMRGAKEHAASTETTALKGVMMTNPSAKLEFLKAAQDTLVWGKR